MAAAVQTLWGVPDVMLILKMRRSWVYARVESGEIPSLRLPGGRIRFDPADIHAWIERQKAGPAQVLALHRGG